MSNADERRHVREATFWSKVEVLGANQCWEWRGPRDHGYGITNGWAHRKAWEFWNGAIPKSKCIDHICRNRGCVNPRHLRLRDPRENSSDIVTLPGGNNGYGRKTHCKRGHPFDEQNTMLVPGGRNCRQCVRDYSREWHRKDREKKRANA